MFIVNSGIMFIVNFLILFLAISQSFQVGWKRNDYSYIKRTISASCIDIFDISDRLTPYMECEVWQKGLQDLSINLQATAKSNYASVGSLLIVQHDHVYTLGTGYKSTSGPFSSKIGSSQCRTINVDRAGDITYHGPGQVVLYPILDLNYFRNDIHRYLRSLEQIVINTAGTYGIAASRIAEPGYSGVWVGNEKIAAIGLKVRRWVSMHGIAVNVDPDMQYFANIVPCGISDTDKSVGSLRRLNTSITLAAVTNELRKQFMQEMNVIAGSTREGDDAVEFLQRKFSNIS